MSDLSRFVKAQETDYERALSEIHSGHKRSHWIWYIFPQIAGLGFSSTAQYYAIKDRQEKVLDKFFEGKPDQRTIELL